MLAKKYLFTYKEIKYKDADVYFAGKGDAVVILLHGGYPSKRAAKEILARFSKYFNRSKIIIASVNYRPSGFGGKELADVLHAIEYWKSKGKKVFIMGKSHGGYLALLAGTYEECNGIIDIAGPTDLLTMEDFSLEHLYLPLTFSPLIAMTYRECGGKPSEKPQCYANRSPFYRAEKMRCRVLIIHGTKDDVVPIEQAYEMEGALRKFEKEYEAFYVNATHLDIDKKKEVIQRICEFIGREVGNVCVNE